jgi:hypothetical protein
MLIILLIVLAAFLLRAYAVANLPVDFDEPVYLRAAQHYAAALRAGDWDEIRNYAYVREHPPLMKLVYALVIAGQPPAPDLPAELDENYIPPPALIQVGMAARAASALLGTLAVLLIALVNPLAGLALALHTYTIKYTAQIYLEALPMLTSAVAVLAYARAQRQERGRAWWVLSAVALGLTAAAKYVYCVAGLAIGVDYLWRVAESHRNARTGWRRPLLTLAGWGALSLLIFYAGNPYLWPAPISRLLDTLLFHVAFSRGAHVQSVGYPFYQPFIWLFTSVPWHPFVIFTQLDGVTAVLGLIGLNSTWQSQRIMVIWWAVGLLFLLLWSTKWPQYILVITVPVAFCAAAGLAQLWAWFPDHLKGPVTFE